ncbi:MAG TPA: UrcA family protein [Hyphomonadaceae bacterium]|nr:UrcA family protein [Hyphomonadaceae bacterium]
MTRVLVTLMTALAITAAAPKPALAENKADALGFQTSSISVFYGDLDLSNPAGVDTLMKRMTAAARTVCGWGSSSFNTRPVVQACMHSAIMEALNNFGSPAGSLTADNRSNTASR